MRYSTLVNEPSPRRERHRFIVALTVLLCLASLSLPLSWRRSSPESSMGESAEASGVKVATTNGTVKISKSIDQPNQSNARTGAEAYGKLPLHFEGNAGQADPHIKFLSHGRGY